MNGLHQLGKKFYASSPSNYLTTAAILSGLIYLFVFTLPFPLTKYYNTIPPVDYTKLTGYSLRGFLVYVFGIGALFGLYIWAFRLYAPTGKNGIEAPTKDSEINPAETSAPTTRSVRPIFLGSATFALTLIFSYPVTAIDIFVYAIHTRGWALYNLLPSKTPPEALPSSDPWLGLAGEWVDNASPYGSVWELLSLGAFYLSGGGFLSHLFALKILVGLAYLGCAWLVYQTLRQLRPDWAIAGTIAFAWNPLVLFETAQNGHNDIVMIFFLMAAVWVFVRSSQQRQTQSRVESLAGDMLVCLLLTLSILVKLVTIIVAPFFVLALAMRQPNWPRRITLTGLYSLIISGLIFISMLPIWPGWENWSVVKVGSKAGRSLLTLLVLGLRDSMGTNPAFDLSRNLILAIFALIYLFFLWKTITTLYEFIPTFNRKSKIQNPKSPLPTISAAFFVLFWYVLLAAPVFHGWYLLWFLPLVPLLLPQQRPLIAALIFSITALLIIPYFETIRVWYPFLLQNHFLGHLIGVPLLILPPILSLFWSISLTPDSEVSSRKV